MGLTIIPYVFLHISKFLNVFKCEKNTELGVSTFFIGTVVIMEFFYQKESMCVAEDMVTYF